MKSLFLLFGLSLISLPSFAATVQLQDVGIWGTARNAPHLESDCTNYASKGAIDSITTACSGVKGSISNIQLGKMRYLYLEPSHAVCSISVIGDCIIE